MSKHQMIKKRNRIGKMPVQRTLLNKEVYNSKQAGLYLGLTPDYVGKLARKNEFPSFRPNNGRCYYRKRDLDNWLFSLARGSMAPISEAEKMAILNQEGG